MGENATGQKKLMLWGFFVQNVSPQEGRPYWVQGMRSLGAEQARHMTGQLSKSEFEILVGILLSPPIRIGPKPAPCFIKAWKEISTALP